MSNPAMAKALTHWRRPAAAAMVVLHGCGGSSDAEGPNALAQHPVFSTKAGPPHGAAAQDSIVLIVRLEDSPATAREVAARLLSGSPGQLEHVYEQALKGFSVRVSRAAAEAVMAGLRGAAQVRQVEVDRPFFASQSVQTSVAWGLDRIDQRSLPLSGAFEYASTGAGVRVYLLDTGIMATHSELGGRVEPGYSAIADGQGAGDCNGHGTHVAGLVGATTYGVAKTVSLVPVRVLGCDGAGSLSGILAGLDWVAGNARAPSAVNMALGGGASETLDAAVAQVVSRGFVVVAAAGNEGSDACGFSPAREPTALTVGATAADDGRSAYSNFGACLDLFSPGTLITSAWPSSATATNMLSGTSMASGHVAGRIATLLEADPSLKPAQVIDIVKSQATRDKVANSVGSPNLLLYSREGETIPVRAASVSELSGTSYATRKTWRAVATVTVRDASGQAVEGAWVDGYFQGDGGTLTCLTTSAGACSVEVANLAKAVNSITYSVTGVRGARLAYAPEANAKSAVLIARP